jgi:uncharacterized OB-fold protein
VRGVAEFTTKSFNDYLREKRIRGTECGDCGSVHLPPRPLCPNCSSRNLKWIDLRGEGVIQSFTVIYVPLTRMQGRSPYAVGVVKLDDGPSISGLILDVSGEEEISVGSRVRAEFVSEGEKTSLCFRLV